MAYPFSNNCTKNYWNQTTTVKIIVEGWVVGQAYFFVTQFSNRKHSLTAAKPAG